MTQHHNHHHQPGYAPSEASSQTSTRSSGLRQRTNWRSQTGPPSDDAVSNTTTVRPGLARRSEWRAATDAQSAIGQDAVDVRTARNEVPVEQQASNAFSNLNHPATNAPPALQLRGPRVTSHNQLPVMSKNIAQHPSEYQIPEGNHTNSMNQPSTTTSRPSIHSSKRNVVQPPRAPQPSAHGQADRSQPAPKSFQKIQPSAHQEVGKGSQDSSASQAAASSRVPPSFGEVANSSSTKSTWTTSPNVHVNPPQSREIPPAVAFRTQPVSYHSTAKPEETSQPKPQLSTQQIPSSHPTLAMPHKPASLGLNTTSQRPVSRIAKSPPPSAPKAAKPEISKLDYGIEAFLVKILWILLAVIRFPFSLAWKILTWVFPRSPRQFCSRILLLMTIYLFLIVIPYSVSLYRSINGPLNLLSIFIPAQEAPTPPVTHPAVYTVHEHGGILEGLSAQTAILREAWEMLDPLRSDLPLFDSVSIIDTMVNNTNEFSQIVRSYGKCQKEWAAEVISMQFKLAARNKTIRAHVELAETETWFNVWRWLPLGGSEEEGILELSRQTLDVLQDREKRVDVDMEKFTEIIGFFENLNKDISQTHAHLKSVPSLLPDLDESDRERLKSTLNKLLITKKVISRAIAQLTFEKGELQAEKRSLESVVAHITSLNNDLRYGSKHTRKAKQRTLEKDLVDKIGHQARMYKRTEVMKNVER